MLKAALLLVPAAALTDESLFELFKSDYVKSYNSTEAEAERCTIFSANLRKTEALNAQRVDEDDAEFGVTQFMDLTEAEFKAQYLNYVPSEQVLAEDVYAAPEGFAAPGSLDWRTKQSGVVSDVKDQGQCGSCWAFSATEQIESEWVLAGNDPLVFAPQQIVSCDKVDQGCNGGNTETAYAYVEKAGGMALESAYPYKSGTSGNTGRCKVRDRRRRVESFSYVVPECKKGKCNDQDEDKMAAALASHGPASICVVGYTGYTGDAKACGKGLRTSSSSRASHRTARRTHSIMASAWGTLKLCTPNPVFGLAPYEEYEVASTYELTEPVHLIGRQAHATKPSLVLPFSVISGQHCLISLHKENGTVTKVLQDGDVVTVFEKKDATNPAGPKIDYVFHRAGEPRPSSPLEKQNGELAAELAARKEAERLHGELHELGKREQSAVDEAARLREAGGGGARRSQAAGEARADAAELAVAAAAKRAEDAEARASAGAESLEAAERRAERAEEMKASAEAECEKACVEAREARDALKEQQRAREAAEHSARESDAVAASASAMRATAEHARAFLEARVKAARDAARTDAANEADGGGAERRRRRRQARGGDARDAANAACDAARRSADDLAFELQRSRRLGETLRHDAGRQKGVADAVRDLCGNQIFNPTSMCAYATVSTQGFLLCFENSMRAIDSSKN
ncbi:C1 peptidase-like protein [Aureococcus anophagefferens]|nr:C1 peptidase-like protein [Aureococcus anophagefferens]